jgi:hypothetical protein
MAKKPSNLIYGVDDKLPVTTATLLAIQHVFVMTAGWVMIVVVATTIGANREEVTNVLRMSMIASGIGTILQSLRESHVGSGYLCPISGRTRLHLRIHFGGKGRRPSVGVSDDDDFQASSRPCSLEYCRDCARFFLPR